MKSIFKSVITVFMAVITITFFSCGGSNHEHDEVTKWTTDSTHHWHVPDCHPDEILDKAEHTWDEGTIKVKATCSNEGEKVYKCTVCSYEKVEEIPADSTVHTYSEEWTNDDTDHWHKATCEHSTEISDKSTHTWNDGEVTTPATETNGGVKTFTCTVCGKTKTETIAAGHTHTISKDWTNNETHHWHKASCNIEAHNEGKATHTWNSGVITTDATETKDGVKTFTCTVCKKTKTETIVATGHKHTISTAWTNDETHHWHKASCNIEAHNSSKEEHNWDEGKITGDTKTFTCVVCGYKVTRTTHTHTFSTEWTTDNNHHWHAATCEHATEMTDRAKHTEDSGTQTSEPTCTEEGTITYSCETCEKALRTEIIPALGHTWNDGEVTTAPTCTGAGVKTFTCTNPGCEATRTETIPATGHSWAKTGTGYECSVCKETTIEGNISCEISVVSGDIALNKAGDTSFKATLDDVTTFKWYFNGKELLETSDTCDLSGELRGLAIGYYELIVTAEKNGVTYSSTTKIRIEY